LTSEHLENFAAMAGMECLLIESKTEVSDFVKEPRWNDCITIWLMDCELRSSALATNNPGLLAKSDPRRAPNAGG
jgi:hypothetical protein